MNYNPNNISSLDLFRGIAGYGVAICHFFYYLYDLKNFHFYSIFFVEFFFILSGFVLFSQLHRVYDNIRNAKIFFLRRWYRTIPPYLIALVIYSILFAKFDSDTLKYLFFIQKITYNFVNSNYITIAWSLSIEEFFYLIFPIFLIVLNKKKFLHIIILFISIIYAIKFAYFFSNNIDNEFFRTGTFLRLDSIAFGVLTRIYFEKIKNNFTNILSAISILLLVNFFFQNFQNLEISQLFIFILLIQCLSINLIIIFINFDKLIINKFLINIFSLLSKQTYSVYLFHLVFLYLINSNPFLLNSKYIFVFYLISLFLFSSLFYYAIEKKINEHRPVYKN
jgi:peptidoglycan/LPS O-acetylase OafA/YrhL|tara:strand:+ start:798 stop:1805 length:1008 start_codon:yes stop_codon:yes gene_type:complete